MANNSEIRQIGGASTQQAARPHWVTDMPSRYLEPGRSAQRPLNILFTSIGRRVELVRSFRHAYQALDLKGSIVATDIDVLAPALRLTDRPYITPRSDSPHFVEVLREICQRDRISLIFPLIDNDISVLACNREAIEATGAQIAVVSPHAAEITRDKWLTTLFFQRLGLLTPISWLPEEFDPANTAYPVFIKPRDGSASVNAFAAHNEEQARFFLNYVPFPIIQEWLPGPEITTDVVCGLDGGILGIVSRQRIAVRSGEVVKGVTVYSESIIEACQRIAYGLPGIGPITVQCLLRDGVPHFTEINARFGGGLPLGIAAGVNTPLLLLAQAAHLPVPTPPLGLYETGLAMTRFDDSFFLTEGERVQLASRRL